MNELEKEEGRAMEHDALPTGLAERVLERLGLVATPPNTLEGLDRLYAAWCRQVPFDNLRKLVALHSTKPQNRTDDFTNELPGIHAADFFSNYLQDGCGGTCWPSSNALYTLLDFCGFDARRVAGSMMDSGIRNHGSVIVRLPSAGSLNERSEWLVDSSILSGRVLSLEPGSERSTEDPAHPIRIEPCDPSFRIWWRGFRPDPVPCRLLDDPVDHPFYQQRYEASRQDSVFNEKVCVHRYDGLDNEWMLAGRRTSTTMKGAEAQDLTPAQARQTLIERFGYSEELVSKLDDAMLDSDQP